MSKELNLETYSKGYTDGPEGKYNNAVYFVEELTDSLASFPTQKPDVGISVFRSAYKPPPPFPSFTKQEKQQILNVYIPDVNFPVNPKDARKKALDIMEIKNNGLPDYLKSERDIRG
jgi:hypothetical protein